MLIYWRREAWWDWWLLVTHSGYWLPLVGGVLRKAVHGLEVSLMDTELEQVEMTSGSTPQTL